MLYISVKCCELWIDMALYVCYYYYYLRGIGTKGASWPENKENAQIFPPAGFLRWCCQCFHLQVSKGCSVNVSTAGFLGLICQCFQCRFPRLFCQCFHLQAFYCGAVNVSTSRLPWVVLSMFPQQVSNLGAVNVSTCRLPRVALSMFPPEGFQGWCCQCFHPQAS